MGGQEGQISFAVVVQTTVACRSSVEVKERLRRHEVRARILGKWSIGRRLETIAAGMAI
jgi:hypothetical protein